jgi:hypothetical protein
LRYFQPGAWQVIMAKICDMEGVREYSEGFPVELWRDDAERLTIIARNQDGFDCTSIDFLDLVSWLQRGSGKLLSKDNEIVVLCKPGGTGSFRD